MLSKCKRDKEEVVEMTQKKDITFLIKVMNGGGAERVITILSKALVQRGYRVNLILTHQRKEDAQLKEIDKEITVFSLVDEVKDKKAGFKSELIMLEARLRGKITRMISGKPSDILLIKKYLVRNYEKVSWLREYFERHKNEIAIAFLYDSIFLTLLSKSKNTRVIISERGDPQQSAASKTTMAFLHEMFPKVDKMVFQSPDVCKWYRDKMSVNGKIIFNPIKSDLPEPFTGERQKKIVNFCRISEQKNLELLVNAFAKVNQDYPEYELFIYGDAVGNGAEGYLEKVEQLILSKELTESVHMLSGRRNIHEVIKDYKMFVSSSDFEGMSNSMLEAVAIGLPVVCTDCPAGGARAVIRDYENGILVPVRDEEKLYLAMKEVIEDSELAERLSQNAIIIREEQSVEKIIEQWMEIIND